LGSGKTTAIIGAVKLLMMQGKRAGVVTNDQGRYLVDTAFFKLSEVPAVQVSGTCFCCNYGDLEARIDMLREQIQPDAIFAESIGSCTDLVATVIKPLQRLRDGLDAPTSYSGFVDSRLLRLWLLGMALPFSDNLVYIFEKQIEETNLLILNKVDLLSNEKLAELKTLVSERYPGKEILYQNSTDKESIQHWLDKIECSVVSLPSRSLDIDYKRYGVAEAQLAWLNEAIRLETPASQGREIIILLLSTILNELRQKQAAIGHIKILIQDVGEDAKISITPFQEANWDTNIPVLAASQVHFLLNARVEINAEELRQIIQHALVSTASATNSTFTESDITFFNPEPHTSKHRID